VDAVEGPTGDDHDTAGASQPVRSEHSPAEQTDTPAEPANPESGDESSQAEQAQPDDEADPVLARRDELLTPVISGLARRLKRVLQDDQNDILDRLRSQGGWNDGLLPTLTEHQQRYVGAVLEHLLEAARSGARFVGGKSPKDAAVRPVAVELAGVIVPPLRRRLEEDGGSVDRGDDAALVEIVSAAFRDWKGARIERLAGDHAVAAFSAACVMSMPKGGELRWVVDDDGVQCPDCDDNALAGATPAGEAFPTGHAHPPVHAGCRCVVAPTTA
jgi:hypothetical protein